ncbi:MAG TPA: FtsW/RodA/SpoVE family cell cycle protein [Chloroflexota bacterium]|jgi:peptidoglycan glycosyltransferase
MTIGRLRLTELGLLLPAAGVALVGAAILLLQHGVALTWTALAPALATVVLFVLAHAWLVARRPRADQTLLPIAALLTAVGQAMVTRIEPTLGPRQLVWLGLSMAVWAVVIWFPRPVRWLARYRYTAAALGIVLLASTMVLGVDPNNSGVRIWLGAGGLYFQPSELLKVLLVIFLAAYLDEVRDLLGATDATAGQPLRPSLAHLAPIALIGGVCLGLMLIQRDLGPAFLFFAVSLAMLYVATGRALYAGAGLVLFGIGALVGYRLFSVARVRVDIWLDPWTDAAGRGYQVVQGLLAIANGGVFGVGIGYGHPEILPAAHTDFPFAVLAEEMGLVGAAAVLTLFVVLTTRGFAVALRARDGFSTLLAAGLTSVLALQALIIVAGNLKLLPLTGITLPFVSYGGSSLLTNFLILGLLLRVAAEAGEHAASDRPAT